MSFFACRRRTSGAKALISLTAYGTAEAVPFVLTPFPQAVKAVSQVRRVFP
jgi:hypothetical protein